MTTAYAPAISILRLLIESKGITLTGDTSTMPLPGFLFDMNRFFQSLLSRFFSENLSDCSVWDEFRLRDVIRYDPDYNPRKRSSPTPRPDFVVIRGKAIVGILDAKYRDLWEKSLPRDMLYQLGIYAAVHDLRVATILYPTLDPYAKEARLSQRFTGGRGNSPSTAPPSAVDSAGRLGDGSGFSGDTSLRELDRAIARYSSWHWANY